MNTITTLFTLAKPNMGSHGHLMMPCMCKTAQSKRITMRFNKINRERITKWQFVVNTSKHPKEANKLWKGIITIKYN